MPDYTQRSPTPVPYIMQRHTGLLLFFIGLIALTLPATQNLVTLPWPLEMVLFSVNSAIGAALYFARNRLHIKFLLFAAFAACVATAAAFTFGLGVNTGSAVYLVEAFFILQLLGRVKADLEVIHGRHSA